MSEYATGPGRRTRSRGAVIEAYVDTEALDHKCPKPKGGCGADLGEFCHHPDGTERKMPCPVRIPARPEPEESGETP
ncbi:hypothetical protein ORI20_13900 [Mycobacterium sp. CVI_P3]|uniref:Uncharacterized protein n=1 Tax=Mycobacterium pinniadriaticum TaxID=2994102 RepID=A0ABT3SEI4_9MYCO|nr:hypothetical protein [Mycobacterium pinniadriaticum]MCX2931373.1 hypothetical protein [Mycobacterium pinniadriaticum]MCX2937797.1 hypothetical protein [Mycobacterium pinniadriaticum]